MDGIVRKNLNQIIQSSTEEKYNLDYKKLSYNVFKQRIRLYDFEIVPADTAQLDDQITDSLHSFFAVSVKEVDLQLEKQWDIFLEKELFIKVLRINNPKVRIHQHKRDTQKIKFSQISGDIYRAVTQYLSLLKLKSFDVHEAEIDYSLDKNNKTSRFALEPISFTLQNFRVKEGADTENRILFTDDVELKSGHQKFLLPDSSHEVSFDRFKISTLNNQIEFYNLRVNPLQSDSSKENELKVFIPSLKLKSVDFERAYLKNEYQVNNIIMERPAIKVNINKPNKPKTPEQIAELEKWLDLILVNETRITKGNFAVNDHRGRSKKTYLLNGFSIKLQGVKVDTNILDKIVLSDLQRNYRLSVRELKHQIPEEELLIKVKEIEYSSITKKFNCGNIEISPNEYKQQKKMLKHSNAYHLQNLSLESVSISNLNINDISEGKKTVLSDVIIQQPNIGISYDTLFHKFPDSLRGKKEALPYAFDSISTKRFKVIDAKITLTNSKDEQKKYGVMRNADLELINIGWSELNKTKLDIYSILKKGKFTSGATQFSHPLTKAKYSWKNVDIDPKSKSFFVSEYSSTPQGIKRPKVNVGILKITGLNYKNLIERQVLQAEELNTNRLFIELNTANEKNNALKEIDIKKVSAKRVNIERKHNDSIVLALTESDLKSSSLKVLNSDSSSLKVSYSELQVDINKLLSIGKHGKTAAKAERFSFNSEDSTISVKNISIDPVIQNIDKSSQTVIQQRIASIYATGFSPNKQELGKDITAEHLEICSPTTYASFYGDSEKKNSNKSFNWQVHEWLLDSLKAQSIAVNTLSIDNGNMNILWRDSGSSAGENRLVVDQYTLNSKNFRINKNSRNSDGNLFYAQDNVLSMYNVHRVFPDTINDLKMVAVHYSTQDKNIKLRGVTGSYMMTRNKVNNLFVEGNLDLVEFDGIKPIELSRKEKVNLKGIYVKNPTLEFTQFHDKSDVVSRELSLADNFSDDSAAVIQTILNNLRIENGFVNWNFNDTSKQPIVINHLNLDGEGIEYPNPDKSEKKPKIMDLAFSFGDFQYDVMKKYYQFSFDSVHYDSKEELLGMHAVRLDPNYGIFQFGQKAGFQKSRVELYLSQVQLEGFKGKQLLYENKLSVSLMDIDSLWVRNFKDKRLPENNKYKPLPQERLDSLDMGINIKRVLLSKGEVTHIQIAKNGLVPGKIYFSDLSARASNIINTYGDQKAPELMRLSALGKLMGNGQLSATFEFNNQEPNGLFKGHASLGEFDVRTLNNYLEHTAFVGVKSGNVISAGVDFSAYEDFGAGEMKLLYNDLHVTFLNKEDSVKKDFGTRLKGFIANRVVYTKNPHLFHTKKGLIYTERDTTKEIFHYWSKIAMSGVASSTGIANNKKQLKKVRKELLRREKAILRDEDEFIKTDKNQPYGGKDD